MAPICRVVVMARAPVPGRTKRRLIPAIGAERAAALHRAMIRRAVTSALASGVGPVELWCTPSPEHEVFRALASEFRIELHTQLGPDLGARMLSAIEARPGATAVIGTDCPFLEPDDLVRAAGALNAAADRGPQAWTARPGQACGADVVVAPALDGGYVLIAVNRPAPDLFTGIEWGTGRVLDQTRERARAARLRLIELEARRDVDRPEDLETLVGVLRW